MDSMSHNSFFQEMVAMVSAELAQQGNVEAVAQSVVERVKRIHHDAYARQKAVQCSRHEDMTLLIRTINYPLSDGSLTPTQGKHTSLSAPLSLCACVCVCASGCVLGLSVSYITAYSEVRF